MNTSIKSPFGLLLVASALLAHGPSSGFARELVTRPDAAQAAHNVQVVNRARRAFLRFANACLGHNRSGIARAVTDTLVVEYDLPDPGMTLTVDSDTLDSLCATTTLIGSADQISDLSIFPMTDPNTVFIQYEVTSKAHSSARAKTKERAAIIELRGGRIAKIRDFATLPGEIASIATGSAHDTVP